MLFVGGSRAHHYQDLFTEIGMKTVAAGYEFAHRDDYEGRRVLPTIKVDADSRNIEELHVEPDPERYRPRQRRGANWPAGRATGHGVQRLRGHDAGDGGRHAGDRRHQPLRDRAAAWRSTGPTSSAPASRRSSAIQKMGIPCKQLHSYDYGGPYAGFRGAINFYREIDRMVNTRIWSFIKPPWEKEGRPSWKPRTSRLICRSCRRATQPENAFAPGIDPCYLRHTTSGSRRARGA